MEQLNNDIDAWNKRAKVKVLNPIKFKQFKEAFVSLTEIFIKENKDSKIIYKFDDSLSGGAASISIISYAIEIDNINGFINGIKDSYGIEMGCSNEKDKIRFTVGFKPYDYLYIEPDKGSDDE